MVLPRLFRPLTALVRVRVSQSQRVVDEKWVRYKGNWRSHDSENGE